MGAEHLDLLSRVHREFLGITNSTLSVVLRGTKFGNRIRHAEQRDIFEHWERYGIGATCAEIDQALLHDEELQQAGIETSVQMTNSKYNPMHIFAYFTTPDGELLISDHGYMFEDIVRAEDSGALPYVGDWDVEDTERQPLIVPAVTASGANVTVSMRAKRKFVELYTFNIFAGKSEQELLAGQEAAHLWVPYILLQRYIPADEDRPTHILKCLPRRGGKKPYLTTMTSSEGTEVVPVESFGHLCHLFGLKGEGRDMLLAGNQVIVDRGGRDIRETYNKEYLEEVI